MSSKSGLMRVIMNDEIASKFFLSCESCRFWGGPVECANDGSYHVHQPELLSFQVSRKQASRIRTRN
jgi:hypothetical protein